MKVFGFLLWAVLLGPSLAFARDGFSIASPDHPSAWYNLSGEKVSQELDWDHGKERLVLFIAYSTVPNTPSRDQTLYTTFRLSFPMVRRDYSTDRIYFVDENGRKVDLGRLRRGIFGTEVVLNDQVRLAAHRQDGVINATISSGDPSSP